MLRLKLKGTPREMGQAHGEAFAKEIRQLADIRRHLIEGFLKDMSKSEIDELSMKQVAVLQQKYPVFFEEFAGISEASKVSAADLMILNNYTDMRDFSKSVRVVNKMDEGGCSVLAAHDGPLNMGGQTWDMHASACPFMTYLEFPDMHVLTLAGCLGLAGVNHEGVSVFINNLHCQETRVALMWPALVRGMLKQKTAQLAFDYLRQNIPCSGHNYLICDGKKMINVETTGARFEVSDERTSGVSFHTNHYTTALGECEYKERRSPSTDERWKQLEGYFKTHPTSQLSFAKLCEDVFGGLATPAISQEKPATPHASMTCGGIAVDYAKKTGVMWGGLYNDKDHIPFKL